MPVPYAIPGYAYVAANALLGALGTAATPSQAAASNYVATVSSANGSPIVLTGVNQSLANVSPILTTTRKLIISGTVGCLFTGGGEAPTDSLRVNLTVNGVPVFAPLAADCTQGGATISFTYEVSLPASTPSIHLEAFMLDAGTPFTVNAGDAQLTVQIVNA